MDTIETRQGRAGMNTHETIPNLSAEDLATFLATDVMYGDHKLTIGTMPVCAILYFAQYGANKSRQDSVAGWATALEGKGPQAWSAEDRAAYVKDNDLVNDSVKAIMEHRMASRLDAILSDSIGAPRKVGRERMIYLVALDMAKDAFRSAKKPWPTKAADQKLWVDKVLAGKGRPLVEAEADRQMAVQAELDAATDDIFA